MHLPVDDQEIAAALKKHGAYVTPTRIAVLRALLQCRKSVNLDSIRKLSPVVLDRISLYRTIRLFLKKGLIRIVPNSKGNPHYILADVLQLSSLSPAESQLAYFTCNSCGYTEVIDQNISLEIARSDRYSVNNCYIVLEGLCSECKYGQGI